jgi:hypothetical protein
MMIVVVWRVMVWLIIVRMACGYLLLIDCVSVIP